MKKQDESFKNHTARAVSRPGFVGRPLRTTVIIPTYNSGGRIGRLIGALKAQTLKNISIIVVDSSSTDGTAEDARKAGARVEVIPKREFDHGGTRTLAGKMAEGEFLIYLTQDAMPVGEGALENLLKPFSEDAAIAAVYGRQLPAEDASAFAAHLRLFNYPEMSSVKCADDKKALGFKTVFVSNSFCAYRRGALEQIGWFKAGMITNEDTHAGAKMLLAGFKIAYAANAAVRHSHNYTAFEEARRYFDIGVFHRTERWMLDEFGGAGGEGGRFVKTGFRYLAENRKYHLVPEFIFRSGLKFVFYKLGMNYARLPWPIAARISRNRTWWGSRA